MDIFTDRVGLAALDEADRLVDLVKILTRIYANKSAGRTIFLARIRLRFCSRRIHSRVMAEIAFYGEQVFGLCDRLWYFGFSKRERGEKF